MNAGIYNYTCNITANQNWTANTSWQLFTINKADNPVYLKLNGVQGDNSVIWPTQVSPVVTSWCVGKSCPSLRTLYLYRNDTSVVNAANEDLGVGVWEFKANATGSANYLDNATGATYYMTVNQSTINPIDVYITNTTDSYLNQDVTTDSGTETTVNGALVYTGSGTANLYRNGSAVSNPDTQTLSNGDYEYKANITGNANCSDNATGVTFLLTIKSSNGAPLWQTQDQNTSTPTANEPVLLYAQGYDDTGLDYAVLETNETATWDNKSTYDSPMNMGQVIGTWTWSNFSWVNASTPANTVVGWKIYYNDTANLQNATDILTFTVQASTSISMVTNIVGFGDIATDTWNDTSDNNPAPFKVRNDGNLNLNISINASNLWTTAANPTANYTAACGNTTEWSCTEGSQMTYANVPSTAGVFIYNLSWLSAEDEAELDINITSPTDEPAGAKSSTITLTGSAA